MSSLVESSTDIVTCWKFFELENYIILSDIIYDFSMFSRQMNNNSKKMLAVFLLTPTNNKKL